ncbi:hypothetical protein [Alistipes sp.]|uniref:hypothetical protein n=1 Tax=Alistipes sp. TaxID=1872444 RepID=UPI003AF063CC
MMELDNKDKIELIRYRHEDQARLLQTLSHIDLKVFTGFLTLQLALGSFLTQFSFTVLALTGVCILELAMCAICTLILRNNYERRKEAAETIGHCNDFLGFREKGAYLPDSAIDATTRFRPWHLLYYLGIWASFAAIFLILLGGALHPAAPHPRHGCCPEIHRMVQEQ